MPTHKSNQGETIRESTATLKIWKGKDTPRVFKIFAEDQIITMGLLPSNNIVLEDEKRYISRTHAAIVTYQPPENPTPRPKETYQYFIRDLGSSLGTKVNGRYIRKKVLREGDLIEIDKHKIKFTQEYHSGDEPKGLSITERFRKPIAPQDPEQPTQFHSTKKTNLSSLNPEHREFLANLERGGFAFDPNQQPDELLHLLAAAVKADKALIGFHEEGAVHIDYQFGLEREGHIGIDTQLLERLLREGHSLEAGLIMLPLPENQFLALIRTEEPVFEQKDLEFLLEATRYLEKSHYDAEDCALHTPWPMSVVGLGKKRAECLEIAKSQHTRNSDVLLLGETGTGKEVMAKFIHEQSAFASGPFLTVSCPSLPETLLYGELFGWEKGAHVTAWEMRKGYFELANGGTLFLDEIGDFPENVQVALLTAMQTRKIRRLGDRTNRGVDFNCRIIAATDRNIEKAVEAGTFRPALRKRFAFEISLPPLRERTGEIPILANYFLDRYSSKTRGISRETLQRLRQYEWPGNVRELQNVIRESALAKHDIIFSWDLPLEIRHAKKVLAVKNQIQQSLRETEKERIETVLLETRGNKIEAARLLGIQRSSLYSKIKKYKIPKNFGTGKEQDVKPEDSQ